MRVVAIAFSMLRALRETAYCYCLWCRLEFPPVRRKLPLPKDRELLIICCSLPPTYTVGTLRPMSFARYAGANGWSARIAGLRENHAEGMILPFGPELLPPGVQVVDVPLEPYQGSVRLSPRVHGGFIHGLRLAAACLRAINRSAVVLATGPDFLVFVAGLLVAKHLKVPLVLDYRDEWTTIAILDRGGEGRWNEYFERRCLAAASAVLFTTESFLKKARKKWPKLAGPHWRVLPNGFEPDEINQVRHASLQNKRSSFCFLFAGALYETHLPERLVTVVEAATLLDPSLMNCVRFRFVGQKSESLVRRVAGSTCKDLFELVPPVPRTEIWKEFAAAMGLLIVNGPGWETTRPTKLYEYMPSTKPILYFGPPGEASAVIDSTGAGVVVTDGEPHALLRAVRACLEAPEAHWDTAERQTWAAQYTRAAIAKRLFTILDALVAQRSNQAPT